MVFKRCKYNGCESSPRCDHAWWIQIMREGDRERGPVEAYVFLLPAPADGSERKVPTTKSGAEDLEKLVGSWMIGGRLNPPRPEGPRTKRARGAVAELEAAAREAGDGSTADAADAKAVDGIVGTFVRLSEGAIVPARRPRVLVSAADGIYAFARAYLPKSGDNGAPSVLARLARELRREPIAALFDRRQAREYLDEIEDESSVVNRNRHRAKWMSLLKFLRLEYKIALASPFYDEYANPDGIKKLTEGDGRKRRLREALERADGTTIGEEEALLEAAAALPDGGMMLGRIYCAIDTGLRRGEMLKLTRRDVLRNYQKSGVTMLRVRWTAAKTKRERLVPVESERLLAFLETRAFCEYPFGQADGTRLDSFRPDWEAILLAAGIDTGHWSERRISEGGHRYRTWIRTTAEDDELHWHDLRHECGSRLAESGKVNLMEIALLLGHTNLATTHKYLNPKVLNLAKNMRRALAAPATNAAAATAAMSEALAALEHAIGNREAAAALVAALVHGKAS